MVLHFAINMEAMELNWMPRSLTGCCFSVIAVYFRKLEEATSTLPVSLQFSIYQQLYYLGRLDQLAKVYGDLEIFSHLLMVKHDRLVLHQSFQAIRDNGVKISKKLAEKYQALASNFNGSSNTVEINEHDKVILRGFSLGTFFLEAGWNEDAATVLSACLDVCLRCNELVKAFHCVTKLLHTYNANCLYKEAESMFLVAQNIFQSMRSLMPEVKINLSSLFVEYGAYHFAMSEYNKAYRWSIEALRMLKEPGFVSEATLIDVLRLASRACVVKRQFKAAECLVCHAVVLSREAFGHHHPKHSSTLLDYGFYLLNIDNVSQSLKVYQAALVIRQHAFGGRNLHVAIAHEDLAYATYVYQYSTGNFHTAKIHADEAIKILKEILPDNHLLSASSNRVKALILEEIAIDSTDVRYQKQLLEESQELHLKSLELAKNAYGENNVQTAKHYGNLGRLYQSMELYEQAEEMHLKAIAIKEELLGPNDYEVALSLGHIASLYNYDMKQYNKAELLYLRSIAIARQLYGDGYSGLEYDYRGLIKVYTRLGDFEKMIEYDDILIQWHSLREQQISNAVDPWKDLISNKTQYKLESTGTVLDTFFERIQSEDIAPTEITLGYDMEAVRDAKDIAFSGPIYEHNPLIRLQNRGNDHRNVGDGAVSHPPVCLTASCSLTNTANDKAEFIFCEDTDISEALKKFHVVPLKMESFKYRKMKKL